MKVGDLVKISNDTCDGGHGCGCWFCYNSSNGLGMVLKCLKSDGGHVRGTGGYWSIMFDVGEWRLYGSEIEVISMGRRHDDTR